MAHPMFCNVCQKQVSDLDHRRHWHIFQALANADVPGGEDLFVHQRGGPNNFDDEGRVVVCDHCLVVELADNLVL